MTPWLVPILRVVDICATMASVPAVLAAGYLELLAVMSIPNRGRRPPKTHPFFDVIIPAHDEEAQIAATVADVLSIDYPRESFHVVVVADNCTDATAEIARASGAEVLERIDPDKRGKGYALACAFAKSLERGRAHAVVVVDADTYVSKNLLQAFAARLEAGEEIVQAEYCVRNPNVSWRTRLMVIALALFHTLRSRARESLGVSCGLRGNGMGFSSRVLRDVPYNAFSIVEDVEYGIRLGEAGYRVAYVGEAAVLGEMVAKGADARSQRQRWESGRRDLARAHGWRLIRRGLAERSGLLLDLGADLLLPPLTRITMWIVLGLTTSVVVATLGLRSGITPFAWLPWTAAAIGVVAYVLRGVQLSGVGVRGVLDLFWAPVFVAWKLLLPAVRPPTWVRTTREKAK
jgi:1,2-diacylglycerol 3-beta-glucosyltransferase